MKRKQRDWASLPQDVLGSIAEKADSVEDYVGFGLSCRDWNLATKLHPHPPINSHRQPPWCFLPEKEQRRRRRRRNNTNDDNRRSMFSFSSGRMLSMELPEIKGRRCWGTPYGWLITHGQDLEIQLFNPLTRASMPLPSQVRLPDHKNYMGPLFEAPYYLEKAVLFRCGSESESEAESSTRNWIVFAIHNEFELAYAKPGDRVWSPILQNMTAGFYDIVCFKGNFYACRYNGSIFTFDLRSSSSPEAVRFAEPPSPSIGRFSTRKYLVECGGELYLVVRFIGDNMDSDDEDSEEEEDEGLEYPHVPALIPLLCVHG